MHCKWSSGNVVSKRILNDIQIVEIQTKSAYELFVSKFVCFVFLGVCFASEVLVYGGYLSIYETHSGHINDLTLFHLVTIRM